MIPEQRQTTPRILSGLAAAVALLTAGWSLYDVDVYRPSTPDSLIPGAVSQDLLTVVAAVGVFACLRVARRGRGEAWLIWVGLMAYLIYAYALYAFEQVYKPLFLAYVAVLGLSVYALATFFAVADLRAVSASRDPSPPRRSTAALLLLLVALFTGLWLSILLPAMATRTPPEGSTIFVLDLALVLPLLVLEARLLLRASPIGDVLAVPILTKAVTLGVSVLLGTLLAPAFGRTLDAVEVATYALLGLGPLGFLVVYVRRITVTTEGTP